MRKNSFKIITLFFLVFLAAGAGFCRAEVSKIDGLQIESELRSIRLSWQKVNLSETESVVIIRKENRCPNFYDDGEEVYRGSGEEYEDRNVGKDKKYCYGAYIYDFSGRTSNMSIAGPMEKANLLKYLAKLMISENNYFIVGEFIVFLVLLWVNIKRDRIFRRKNNLKIIRINEDRGAV
jgi:hypothetical protein